MKIQWQCIYIILTLLFITDVSPGKSEIIDSSVAVVNEDVITLSDVNRVGKAIFRQIIEEAPVEQQEAALQEARKKIIDQLIENKLLTQQAAALNISVTEPEIDHARKQILQRNNFTEQDFKDELQKMGLSQEQYRETLRQQILRSKLINYEIRAKVVITDEEIEKYFEQKYSKQAKAESYYVLQLGISWAETTQPAKIPTAKKNAYKWIKEAHTLAKQGQDFKELARKYSNLPSATDGGDLGFFKKDEMAAYMRDAVTILQPGEISPIIERPESYTFFKLLQHVQNTDNDKPVLDKNTQEEIRNTLYKQQAEERYKEWLTKIRDEAYIKIL
jgi:peptidyl-prolyl cis-trans isomerase SurA